MTQSFTHSALSEAHTVHLTSISVKSGDVVEHVDWLVRLMMVGVGGGAVLSAEIIPPNSPDENLWMLVQRFQKHDLIAEWKSNSDRLKLLEEAAPKIERNEIVLTETSSSGYGTVGSVAIAIVTHVKAGLESTYPEFEKKFQLAQVRRKGYRGVYLQPPTKKNPNEWTTLIRFDSLDALDEWFVSAERKMLIGISEPVVSSTDTQRVTGSFPGWFPGVEKNRGGPANWKTAMLILLGLYPIVMLEIRFLNPILHGLPSAALTNFIGNSISVALTTWVTMPLLIKAFTPWLFPEKETPSWVSPLSISLLVVIFALEIALLWRLL
jgi:antibiotic biosynthesis monooxygenase (ABM) superfamily enzyme